MGLEIMNHKIMTWAEIKSQEPPGAPKLISKTLLFLLRVNSFQMERKGEKKNLTVINTKMTKKKKKRQKINVYTEVHTASWIKLPLRHYPNVSF